MMFRIQNHTLQCVKTHVPQTEPIAHVLSNSCQKWDVEAENPSISRNLFP